MRLAWVLLATLPALGCAPTYSVREADSRFSESKDPLFVASGNRISKKSIAGGIHIDDSGVLVDPYVMLDRVTGGIRLLGFHITNLTDHTTMYGDVNQLGTIESITFRLPDGTLIKAKVFDQKYHSPGGVSYNPIGRYASYSVTESGSVIVSKDDFEKLALADRVSCQIRGTTRNVVYEENEIEAAFLVNIRDFYEQHVKLASSSENLTEQPAARQAASVAPASSGYAPKKSAAPKNEFAVGKIARSMDCDPPQLLSASGSTETFQAACPGGQSKIIQCEFTNCRVMQ